MTMYYPGANPFPMQRSDGKAVIDERCRCGRPRTEHEPGGGGAFGHGPCAASGCGQFTWAGSVLAEDVT